ncbi:MAG: UDP-glucose 4-epimerase GalE [Candidatus Izemoplasmatales bacterium]|jgi:UDP-glucose 4-epimerase
MSIPKKHVLVTGGAGYIGSHTVVEMLETGYEVIIVDNLVNSSKEAIRRIERITGKSFKFYEVDIRCKKALEPIFIENKIDAIIHFAGLKAVGESVEKPIEYYDNNVGGTLSLIEMAIKYHIKNIIFSSSATVYGNPDKLPIDETSPLKTTNPYGSTKLMIEQILTDVGVAHPEFIIVLLRYFNPVGAHPSGLIGENPTGIPNNLTPYLAMVAAGKLPLVHIYGNDYHTIDGTGVRDYIHVLDLSHGHILALEKVNKPGVYIYNLGTGRGYSVFEVLHAFEEACGKTLPYVIDPRRPGDIDASFANVNKAKAELGFQAKLGINDMCQSLWKFQCQNPNGYSK